MCIDVSRRRIGAELHRREPTRKKSRIRQVANADRNIDPLSNGAQLEAIAPLLSNETIKVVIDSSYPLAQASQAHARAEQGHIQGKIVLTVR